MTIETQDDAIELQVTQRHHSVASIYSNEPIAIIGEVQDEKEYPDGGFHSYLIVAGSFLGLIVNLGIINSIGAIQVYVSNHQLADVKATTISWIFSIYLALAYFIAIFTGPIFDRNGPLGLLVCSTVLIFLGLMGSANSVAVWQFVLSFISLGIGNGLGMTPLIGVISHWFLKKRGNCTGIATSGGSVGGLIFPLMLRHTYAVYGYEWAIRILAFTCLGCMILATVIVRPRFSTKDNEDVSERGHKFRTLTMTFDSLRSIKLNDPKYIYVILGAFFAELSLVLLLTYFATYAIAQGVTEATSYILLAVWSGTGIFGRWIPGYVSDHYGRFNINVVMLLVYNLAIFVLWLPFGSNLSVLFAFSVIGGFSLGSILSLLPACLAQITPVNEFGAKYGLLNACLSFANLFGIPIASVVIGNGSVHNYNMFVVFVGILSVIGTFFWYLSRFALVGFKLNVKV